MPDITMCKDVECSKKYKSYRFMAIPSEYRQAYFVGTPREGKECEYFDGSAKTRSDVFSVAQLRKRVEV